MIDNQAAAAARDFAKRAVVAADARFAMEKTFDNGQSETFHEGRINRETTFAISAQQSFVINMTQPAHRAAAHPQFPNCANDLIQRRADVATNGRVTILVSHRFSTVRMADLIIVLDGARVVEVGAHEELIARAGQYADLFAIQAAAYR